MASQVRSVNNTITGMWTNPNNAFTENAACTTTASDGVFNDYNFINNPFTIPTGATITGLAVRTKRAGDGDDYYTINLYDAGGFARTKTGTAGPTGNCSNVAYETLGNSSDLWGGSWTATHINSSAFRALIRYQKTGKANTYYVDHVEVTVYYETIVETLNAKTFPMEYLEAPVEAEELKSTVQGGTKTEVSKDFPLTMIKTGKAKELRTRWT